MQIRDSENGQKRRDETDILNESWIDGWYQSCFRVKKKGWVERRKEIRRERENEVASCQKIGINYSGNRDTEQERVVVR